LVSRHIDGSVLDSPVVSTRHDDVDDTLSTASHADDLNGWALITTANTPPVEPRQSIARRSFNWHNLPGDQVMQATNPLGRDPAVGFGELST